MRHKSEYADAWKRITIINCFDTYEPRAELLRSIFSEAGYSVLVCTSDFRHIAKTYRQEKRPGYLFFHAKPYRRNLSLRRMYSHKKLSGDIFSYVADRLSDGGGREELLWIMVPPNSFVRDAAVIKHIYPQTRIIFDLMDLWPETVPYRWFQGTPFFWMWKLLRDRHLSCADAIAVECGLYKHVLRKVLHGKTVHTLYLARPKDSGQKKPLVPQDKLVLCFLGSVNYMTDCETVADIIRKCQRQMPVILHVIGGGERKGCLISSARKAGAQVVDHGMVFDWEKKRQIFALCHYGLNVMKPQVCVGLTMKSIDYLQAGLPMINTVYGDTWKAVEKYGIGVNYSGKSDVLILPDAVEAGRNARRFFEKNLTEEVFKRRVMDMVIKLQLHQNEKEMDRAGKLKHQNKKRVMRSSNYGIGEILKHAVFLLRTRLWYPSVRLIRFPITVRGKRYISWGKGLKTGYRCRFEVNGKHTGKVLVFGDHVNVGDAVSIRCAESIRIGNHVLMGSKVLILDNSHGKYQGDGQDGPDTAPDERRLFTMPVNIEDNVWIGEGSVIQMGVTIGKGSIIAAGSVVTKDIPSGVIAGGVPAKVLKKWNQNLGRWEPVCRSDRK